MADRVDPAEAEQRRQDAIAAAVHKLRMYQVDEHDDDEIEALLDDYERLRAIEQRAALIAAGDPMTIVRAVDVPQPASATLAARYILTGETDA